MKHYDVVIIGAGVVGCAVAREISRYQLNTLVIEKEPDVACGNSSRNTGVLHAGFTYKPGSLKAECSVEGNEEFDRVAEELEVNFKRTGKVVVGFDEKDRQSLLRFKENGEKNGVKGLRIIEKEELNSIDSSAGGEFAMYSPNSGILNPMQYTIALAENAHQNGVEFAFQKEVTNIEKENDHYILTAGDSQIRSRFIINCAGMNCVRIAEMMGIHEHHLKGFKGEYFVLDKKAGDFLNIPVYPAPNERGGFSTHATPTVDGNVLIGPDSYVTEEAEDYIVTKEHMDGLVEEGSRMFKHINPEYFIRNYAGIRWKRYSPETGEVLDFLIDIKEENPRVIHLIGIESPGLTCALPLARRVVKYLTDYDRSEVNENFNPKRKGNIIFNKQPREVQESLIKEDPNYGDLICRCESITKAEIIQAINNPLGVHTLTGIKNRTRATMGRCQGGYCEAKITQLIEDELSKKEVDLLYQRKESYMFTGKVRGNSDDY